MSELISCVIVDDEPIARNIIRNYCSHISVLNIIGEFGNALEAKDFLAAHPADLLFLDIHMPVLSGISFLNTLKNPPQVIFTTAYQEYAINAFDLAACDYLLKPFSLDRFIIAVDKVKEKIGHGPKDIRQTPQDFFFIKAEGKTYKVLYQECLYAEAQGNYTKVMTSGLALLTKMAFSDFITLLPPVLFARVHRSFIINKSSISHIDGNRVFIGKNEIPMAVKYKEAFLKDIGIV